MENLQPDTSYEVRIWGISSEGKVYRTSPVHVRTLSNRTSPLPVRSLKVKELLLIEDHYDAIINWTPAKGWCRTDEESIRHKTKATAYIWWSASKTLIDIFF